MEEATLTITKLPYINTIVLKQRGRIFLSTRDSIVIDTDGLELILRLLVINDRLDHEVLERI